MTGREGRSNSVGKSVRRIEERRSSRVCGVCIGFSSSVVGERIAEGSDGRFAVLAKVEFWSRTWTLARRFCGRLLM